MALRRRSLLVLGAASMIGGLCTTQACRGPTQITIEVSTDVTCTDVRGTAITVGELAALETKPATTVTPACDPASGRIGSMVIVPSGERDEQVSVRLVMGLGRDPAECQPPAYGPGCIVARRALRFIPGQALLVPVFMGAVCNGIPCEATQTCTGGTCASAVIDNSAACAEPGGCGESALGGVVPGAPPPPVTPDASVATDAAVTPTIPIDPVAACGRPSTYVDDFAARLGPEWVGMATAAVDAVNVQAGELVLKSPASGRSGISSRYAVHLADDRIRVELPRRATPGTSAVLAARAPGGDELSFVAVDNTLTMRRRVGTPDETNIPFDPIAHRWLQIREAAGQIFWETSPDAITWTERRTAQTPAFARWARIVLESRAGGGPGEAYFSRFNAGRPRAPWCKAGTLTDDFGDANIGPAWEVAQRGACTIGESGGSARFRMTGQGASSYCAYESSAAYDLRGSALYIEIPAITTFFLPVRAFIEIEDAQAKTATLSFVGSNELEHAATGIAPLLTTYPVPSAQDWWRIREAGGTLFWETSGDGQTWTIKRQQAPPFPLDRVRLKVGVRTNATMPGAIGIGVPRLNLGGT